MARGRPSAYLANRTDASAFPTQTFPGLGALRPVLAVGALPAVHRVVAADALTTRDPLGGDGGVKVNDTVPARLHAHPKTQSLHNLRRFREVKRDKWTLSSMKAFHLPPTRLHQFLTVEMFQTPTLFLAPEEKNLELPHSQLELKPLG